MSECIFCRIVDREIPAEVVYESADCMAFLDNQPLFPGHVLIVPRQHYATLTDLPDDMLAPLFGTARQIATAMETVLGAEGSFVANNNKISQTVPHLHVHVIPRRKGDGLKGFFWPRRGYSGDDHRSEVAARLRAALQPAAKV